MKIVWDESTDLVHVDFVEEHEETLWVAWDRKFEEFTWGISVFEEFENVREATQTDYKQILYALFNCEDVWYENVEE